MRILLDQDKSRLPEIWQAVCRILEDSFAEKGLRGYLVWIQPLVFVSWEPAGSYGTARLAAVNDFSVLWVRDHFQREIEAAFESVTGLPCRLKLETQSGGSSVEFEPATARRNGGSAPESHLSAGTFSGHTNQVEFTELGAAYPGGPSMDSTLVSSSDYTSPSFSGSSSNNMAAMTHFSGAAREPEAVPLSIPAPGSRASSYRNEGARPAELSLDPNYTFETFIVGASNQFAHAFAVSVAEQPAKQFNPLLIHSRPGLGKTHLLHAIGNHFLLKNPGARVLYVSAERFVNELVDVLIKKGDMSEFRRRYRDSFDMLLIDDVQFIASKEKSEEEFFHTFNSLHNSKRQIVLTSDRPPKEIQGFGDRVITRLEWGPVADIQPPEIETRIAILKSKAERDDIYLPDEVATFLATYIKSNVRELEGTLVKLQAYASLTGGEISIDLARQQLKALIPEETSQYTVEAIQSAVLKHFNLKAIDLRSGSREQRVVLPRYIAMHLIRKYTGISFKEIGHYFGGKDHTTIRHGCEKIDQSIDSDPELRREVEAVQNLL